MTEIINWCNLNNGFLTGVLSLLTLIVSIIAIIVSINTAKLPYKKKLQLSSSYDIAFYQNPTTGKSGSQIIGVSVNIANVGSRNANISYLGISVNGRQEKLTKIRDEVTGTGLIAPTEVKTEFFKKADLIYVLTRLDKKAKISLYACDTEGNEYLKKAGYAYKMVEQLSKA